MATTWTFVRAATPNRGDVVVDIHPPVLLRAKGAQAGAVSGGGAWRGIRGALTAAGTYTTGGDSPDAALNAAGIRQVEAILVVGDTGAAPAAVPGLLRYNTATDKIQLYALAGTELAAAAATVGTWEVIVLGRFS